MILLKITVSKREFDPLCVHAKDKTCGLGWGCYERQMSGEAHTCGVYKPKEDSEGTTDRIYLVSTMGTLDNIKLNNYSMFLQPGEELVSTDIRKDGEIFKDSNCGIFQIV